MRVRPWIRWLTLHKLESVDFIRVRILSLGMWERWGNKVWSCYIVSDLLAKPCQYRTFWSWKYSSSHSQGLRLRPNGTEAADPPNCFNALYTAPFTCAKGHEASVTHAEKDWRDASNRRRRWRGARRLGSVCSRSGLLEEDDIRIWDFRGGSISFRDCVVSVTWWKHTRRLYGDRCSFGLWDYFIRTSAGRSLSAIGETNLKRSGVKIFRFAVSHRNCVRHPASLKISKRKACCSTSLGNENDHHFEGNIYLMRGIRTRGTSERCLGPQVLLVIVEPHGPLQRFLIGDATQLGAFHGCLRIDIFAETLAKILQPLWHVSI